VAQQNSFSTIDMFVINFSKTCSVYIFTAFFTTFPTVWLRYKGTSSANKYAALYVLNTVAHLFG